MSRFFEFGVKRLKNISIYDESSMKMSILHLRHVCILIFLFLFSYENEACVYKDEEAGK
jgi:hypothetical protein